jgi:hypothetical protein
MPERSKLIRISQFPGLLPGATLFGPYRGGGKEARKAMNDELPIYREYCWFALLLLILAIGFIGRSPPVETSTVAGGANTTTAPPANHPP